MRALVGLVVCACGLWSGAATADVTVLLTRNGTETVWRTYPSGTPIADLPTLNETYTMVRVFGEPADVIGPITLTGSRSSVLDLLIAAPEERAMPSTSASLARGGGSLAGIDCPGEMSGRVRLAASVASVAGEVDVGLIRRLDADVVTGSVTAHAPNAQAELAIDGVTVQRRCDGSIRATAGDIGSVRIGQGLEADGLFASLESAGGRLVSLEVNGAIEIAPPGGIRARDGIGLIRCTSLDETGWGAVNAAIDANTGQHEGFEHPTLGALITLECDTLSGSLRARSLDDGLGGGQRRSIRAGLVFADIEVTESVRGRVEVGGFEAPGQFRIGEHLNASITADRGITTLEVGGNVEELFLCVPIEIICANGAIGSLVVHGNIMANSACESVVSLRADGGVGSITVDGDASFVLECGDGFRKSPLGQTVIRGSFYGGFIEASRVDSIEVLGLMDGAFRLDRLPASSSIRIGASRYGSVVVHDPAGLEGQVFSNGSLGGPTVVPGAVLVARPGHGWFSWSGRDCPFTAAELGGGMVAEAPFGLRPLDCAPPRCGTCEPATLPHSQLLNGGVLLRFSGPVRKASETAKTLRLFPAGGGGARVPGAPEWIGEVRVTPVDDRTLRAELLGEVSAGPWVLESAEGGLLCDQLLRSGDHPVQSFQYAFIVEGCMGSDYNRDGDMGTDADIEAFFACLGGVCCPACPGADFDGDGDTGTDADIEAFFRVLGGGSC